MKTGGLQRWVFAGGGIILGVGLGMSFGLWWAKDHAAWVQAIGTVVAAVGTIVAAIFAVLAFLGQRQLQQTQLDDMQHQRAHRDRAWRDDLLRDAREVSVNIAPTGRVDEDGGMHVSMITVMYRNGGRRPVSNLRFRIPPHMTEWHHLRPYIRAGASTLNPVQIRMKAYRPYGEHLVKNLEVRYEIEGTQWAAGMSGDPWLVEARES